MSKKYKLKSSDGNTPLIVAAYNEHIEIVKFLIEKGANIEVTNK